ncbi:MAG: helix-hairpin-helix domain-containing protein [Myxococcales bacterium]
MHNVNRNRANAQEQSRKRHGPLWQGETAPGADGNAALTQSIDLNHATREQLMEIESIGEYEARAIVVHRTLYGHFLSWEDVRRRVPGIDDERLQELQHCARIGSPRMNS